VRQSISAKDCDMRDAPVFGASVSELAGERSSAT